MSQSTPFLSLQADPETGLDLVNEALTDAGLEVQRSFHLQVALTAHADCSCPYHGTERCACQMVVLLVYDRDSIPVTLVVHGYERKTQISLADSLQLEPNSEMIEKIFKALKNREFAMRLRWDWVHAT